MGLLTMENLSGPQESIFNLSRAPSSILTKNLKNVDFLLFPLFGVTWAAVISPLGPFEALGLFVADVGGLRPWYAKSPSPICNSALPHIYDRL